MKPSLCMTLLLLLGASVFRVVTATVKCDSWTNWINFDNPWTTGDWETLQSIHMYRPGQVCDTPTEIEARVVGTGQDALSTGENFAYYDATNGFVCRMADQPDNTCLDYEVRFCCPDATSTLKTTTTQTMLSAPVMTSTYLEVTSPSSTTLGAIIGGVVAAGVVIVIIVIAVSIFFTRRRRSKDSDGNQSSPRPDERRRTDRIYTNAVMFRANGNASNNGNVSIGQPHGPTYVNATFDQSEEMMSNDPYPYATSGDVIIGQSEETVDDTIYMDIRDVWVETSHHFLADSKASFQQLGTSNGDYVNIPPAPSSGDYQELRPAVYQSLQKY